MLLSVKDTAVGDSIVSQSFITRGVGRPFMTVSVKVTGKPFMFRGVVRPLRSVSAEGLPVIGALSDECAVPGGYSGVHSQA